MVNSIHIGKRGEFQMTQLWDMYRLRAQVFRERMGWDITVLSGMEIDGYDALDPYYMIVEDGSQVTGCWRLLPTVGPNMLKDTFPQLMHGQEPPCAPDTWELSRFAIKTDGAQACHFAELTLQAMREVVSFGDRMGIRRYVTVTTTPVERSLRRTGISIRRFGPPIRIGVENAVALELENGVQSHEALFGKVALAA